MLHTKDQAYRNECLQNQYIVVQNKSYKHNEELHYAGMYSPFENLNSHIKIRKIKPKLLFDSCIFEQLHFSKVDLSEIGFINCSFVNCIFDGCSNLHPSKIMLTFMSCNFQMCRFTDCKFFNRFVYACCFFKDVLFINGFLVGTVFSQCCYVNFKFVDNCKLSGTQFLSPSGCFDVQFENNNGYTKIDQHTKIDSFVYKETGFNEILDEIIMLDTDRAHRTKNGFMNFLTQMKMNDLPQHNSDIFYKFKKAETRTIKKWYERCFWIFTEGLFGYGEKPFRITIGMVITIFIYSFIYLNTGFYTNMKYIKYVFDPSRATFNWELINNYKSSFYFSLFTFISVGLGKFTPTSDWSEIFYYSELVCGVVLITLFTTSVVRRLTR